MMQMLGNVRNLLSLLLRDKNILFKRNNLPPITCNIRSKSVASSKDQLEISEIDSEGPINQPIKYSTSRAATMKVDEYRDPYKDIIPWYQPWSVCFSVTVFLIYFCILREENDIDLMLNNELGDSLKRIDDSLAENRARSK